MNHSVDILRPQRHDYKAECSGLAYMIGQIYTRYIQAKALGGDSELLASAIVNANDYIEGPLWEIFNGRNEL